MGLHTIQHSRSISRREYICLKHVAVHAACSSQTFPSDTRVAAPTCTCSTVHYLKWYDANNPTMTAIIVVIGTHSRMPNFHTDRYYYVVVLKTLRRRTHNEGTGKISTRCKTLHRVLWFTVKSSDICVEAYSIRDHRSNCNNGKRTISSANFHNITLSVTGITNTCCSRVSSCSGECQVV